MSFQVIKLSPQQKENLRLRTSREGEAFSFRTSPKDASMIASIGISQEIGTQNDELARFLYDGHTGTLIPKKSLRSELIQFKDLIGVRIWALEVEHLEIRFPNVRGFFHPGLAGKPKEDLKQLILFPEIVAKYLETENIEAMIVRSWANNTVFGGYTSSQPYYFTNIWELANLDALRYSDLVSRRQIPFLGTHDLVAHIAGTQSSDWDEVSVYGNELKQHLSHYFRDAKNPSMSALILPYMAGIMLDDLAQPPCYGALTRRHVLAEIIKKIDPDVISPRESRTQFRFPESYEKIIQLARFSDEKTVLQQTRPLIDQLVEEIYAGSFRN